MNSAQDVDGTGGLIPYKNPSALMAYYLAIFSLIPCLGLLTGPVAVILGFMGLKRYRENPLVKGVVHSWIGIILGGFCVLLWAGLLALSIISIINAPQSPQW